MGGVVGYKVGRPWVNMRDWVMNDYDVPEARGMRSTCTTKYKGGVGVTMVGKKVENKNKRKQERKTRKENKKRKQEKERKKKKESTRLWF